MLRADLTAPRKQRHTATRILARLVEEHQATGLSFLFDVAGLRRRPSAGDLGRGWPAGGSVKTPPCWDHP